MVDASKVVAGNPNPIAGVVVVSNPLRQERQVASVAKACLTSKSKELLLLYVLLLKMKLQRKKKPT